MTTSDEVSSDLSLNILTTPLAQVRIYRPIGKGEPYESAADAAVAAITESGRYAGTMNEPLVPAITASTRDRGAGNRAKRRRQRRKIVWSFLSLSPSFLSSFLSFFLSLKILLVDDALFALRDPARVCH